MIIFSTYFHYLSILVLHKFGSVFSSFEQSLVFLSFFCKLLYIQICLDQFFYVKLPYGIFFSPRHLNRIIQKTSLFSCTICFNVNAWMIYAYAPGFIGAAKNKYLQVFPCMDLSVDMQNSVKKRFFINFILFL